MAGLFLPWEMKLMLKYLQQHPTNYVDPNHCGIIILAIYSKSRLTVNEARRIVCSQLGLSNPHPNPTVGNMYIWQDDSSTWTDQDAIIPQPVKDMYSAMGIVFEEGD